MSTAAARASSSLAAPEASIVASTATIDGGSALTTARSSAVDPAGPACAPPGELVPTAITTLHFWDDRVLGLVEGVAAEFEAAHPGVDVRFEKSRGGADALALLAAQPQSERAEVVTLPDMSTAAAIQLGAFEPIGACGPDPDALVTAARATYTIGDALWAVPFTVSAPVLYYDREAFRAAGLDPEVAPDTVDELAAFARQIVASGSREVGLVLETGPFSGGAWYAEQFAAQLGEPTFEPDNGRTGDVHHVAWDRPPVVEALRTLQALVADDVAEVIDAGDGTADLLRLVSTERPAAMTIHTSGSLGVVLEVMAGEPQRVGIAPLPAVDDSTTPSAIAGGSALWVTAGQPPAEAAAALEWVEVLASPEVQGRLGAANGFVPVALGAMSTDAYVAETTAWPQLLVAGESLLPGTSPAQLAPVYPAWEDIRYVLAGAMHRILAEGADPAATLIAAEREADALLTD